MPGAAMSSTRVHRSHVMMLLGKLQRGFDLPIRQRDIERELGYPLIEADHAVLSGVIAGLEAVVKAGSAVPR